jgi:hypothetical protein
MMLSKTGKGSNGSVEWDTYNWSMEELSNFMDNVFDGQREVPGRYHAKWYVANDYLGIYMRVTPGVIYNNMQNMFDGYNPTCCAHVIRSCAGGSVKEVYISRY